jgi:phosphoserine phosphatase
VTAKIGVSATRAERIDGRYTGKIIGEANCAKEKMLAVRRIALENGFDLVRSYAYSDSANDRWMLGAVGKPVAVNPSRELRRIAMLRYWPVFDWTSHDAIQDITAGTNAHTEYDAALFRGIPSENVE